MNWIAIGIVTEIPAARRALHRHAGRQGRRVPHRRRPRVRHRRSLPAQRRPAQPRHRARRLGDVPAAQLGDLARKRQGAGRRRRLRAHHPGQGREWHASTSRSKRRPSARPEHGHGRPALHQDDLPLLRGRLRRAGRSRRRRRRQRARRSDHPANFGRLCSKGAALAETIDLDDRLLFPEVHGVRSDWDPALDLVAGKFNEAIRDHGPDSVAFYVSGQLLTEDYYVANKLMKGFIGSANIDTNSRLCMASSVAGHKRAFGADTVPGCYEDLELADLDRACRLQSRLVPPGPLPAHRRRQGEAARHEGRADRPAAHGDCGHRRPAPAHQAGRRRAAVPRAAALSGAHARDQARLHQAAHDRLQGSPALRRHARSLRTRPHDGHLRRDAREVFHAVRRDREDGHRLQPGRQSIVLRAPTRSTPSSTAIWPPAASAGPAWDRSPSLGSRTPWVAARSAASPTCSRRI